MILVSSKNYVKFLNLKVRIRNEKLFMCQNQGALKLRSVEALLSSFNSTFLPEKVGLWHSGDFFPKLAHKSKTEKKFSNIIYLF